MYDFMVTVNRVLHVGLTVHTPWEGDTVFHNALLPMGYFVQVVTWVVSDKTYYARLG